MTTAPFISRIERVASVPSTNDVVAGWLDAGFDEVCIASADVQTAGRGRMGRTWVAPPGAALLVSAGFRPAWVEPDRAWRIAAVVSLAMADAAEEVAGLPDRAVLLKWPNDLVIVGSGGDEAEVAAGPGVGAGDGAPAVRKLGGVLGEATGIGSADPRMIVGIGVNAGWRAADFPAHLAATMTSLEVASGGRPIDASALLGAFLDRLEPRIEALRAGRFDVADWTARQLVRRMRVGIVRGTDPADAEEAVAIGVDPLSGALVVEDAAAAEGERQVHAGEISRLVARV
ncbi:MAG: biotin--[acetyl-CoA-carboxylase] ligase [Chloroflexi bacterium]|nr:biotin--[acetyl-CoA-carboxylase] ligase [Chloroflexota bacterium]